MKICLRTLALAALLLTSSTAQAAPYFSQQRSLVPADATENIGTSTAPWDIGFFNQLCLAGDCKTAWPSGGSGGGLASSTPWTSGFLAWIKDNGTLSGVATTSLTATSPLSLSQPISVIGTSASALSISTAGDWAGTLDGIEASGFEQGLTAGDGLTRTSNDFDCDTASGSVFGCLSSTDWTTFNGKQAAGNYITALTGDVTASGPGSVAATLATVNTDVGSFTNANITVNAKGLITAASNGSGGGGGSISTSTALVNKQVVYATAAGTVGSEAGFEYDSATNTLSFVYASSTALTATNLYGALTGNASTATALAANGSNCSAGSFPLGVDASGAVETCTDAWTEAENTSASYLSTSAAAAAYQPLDSDLTTIAGLTATSGNFIVSESNAWASRTPSQVKATLDLEIGTDIQAYDGDLTTYAGITPSANIQTFLGAADYSAMRTQLGLVIGTNVQAYDADLTTYAGITPSANVQTLLGAADYAAFKTSLSLNSVENTALSTWAGSSNITTVGTVATGVWDGTDVAISAGGTGANTKSGAFDALSPMSASGDIIYGGASGTGTRLPKGSDGQVLTLVSGIPDWEDAASGGVTSLAGTSNQVSVSGATGAVTVSLAGPHNFTTVTGLLQGNGTSAITGIGGTAGQFPYYNGTNTLLATSSIFMAANGYIGLGTTTPDTYLTIYPATGGAHGINLGYNTSLTTQSSRLMFTNATPGQGVAVFNESGGLGVYTGATPGSSSGNPQRLSILSGGNVGVGTSTPGTIFSIGSSTQYVNISNTATSTFAFPVRSNCFTTDGTTCIGSGGAAFAPSSSYSTIFETKARFSENNSGGTGSIPNTNGAVLDTTSTANRYASYTINLPSTSSNVFLGSPIFKCSMSVQTRGTAGNAYCGIGSADTSGDLVFDHAGFKILFTAGPTATLYATQSNGGGSETVSSALTTLTTTDQVDVTLKFNGTSSVDYYWRKNNSAWSSATNLTGGLPDGSFNFAEPISISINNASTATTNTVQFQSASYTGN